MRRPWYVTAWETITDIAPGCSCCHLPARRRLGAIQAQHSSARQLVARRSSNSATDTPARPSTRRAPAGAFCVLVGIAQGGLIVKPLAPMELHREVRSGQRLRVLLRPWTPPPATPMNMIGRGSIPRWRKYRQAVLEM
jgi:hypothetical protein